MKNETVKQTVKTGVSFGSVLAIVISYVHWQSIFWAIIHGVFGWFYVIYYILWLSKNKTKGELGLQNLILP